MRCYLKNSPILSCIGIYGENVQKTNLHFYSHFFKFKILLCIVCRQPSNEPPGQISLNSDLLFLRRRLSKILSVVAMATRLMMQLRFLFLIVCVP